MEALHNNGFYQHVRKATRIQGANFSLIDHICIKNAPNTVKTGTLISDLSDYFINFVTFSIVKQRTKIKSNFYFKIESLTKIPKLISVKH